MNNRKLLKYHSWFGLIAGLFLLIMGVSGSILVFHKELDFWFFRTQYEQDYSGELQLDRAIEEVQAVYPGWDTRLKQFEPGKVLVFDLRHQQQRAYLFVHPTSGKILREVDANTHFTSWLLKLHYSLHSGAVGRIIILLAGIVFFLSLLSGIILYRKSIFKVFAFRIRLRPHNKRSFYSSLHRYVGVWALFLNLVLVVTGIILAYTVAKAGLNPLPAPSGPKLEISLNESMAELKTDFPQFTPTYIRLPLNKNADITVFGKFAGDAFYFSEFYNYIRLDYQTGQVTSVKKVTGSSFSNQLASTVMPLHYAEFGGLTVKILYSLIGLSGPFLSITGFLIWLKGRRKKRQKRKKLS
ncbi:PepSY-associated TM helix domain-containing protein [Salegentibacter sediminis]|uniref:PepSY-associated TM helix domain-containing protein n=1 Tax=Salegentibacter sediminis TaxID=1930251 RepID=UPI0009BE1B81|nr:PepSY-associated TM helix domain-containing protein [Salegentibacter sediminis]